MQRIIIGVSGGIAAYKVCTVIRAIAELADTQVHVLPTQAALQFIGSATFEALSHNKVLTSLYEDVPAVSHIELGKHADLIIIAPATADLVAQLANGRSDTLLSASVLTAQCPIILFPAMHTEMFLHPATQKNIRILREYGYIVVEPAEGRLTGSDSGIGRLPEAEEIINICSVLLDNPRALTYDLAGKKVLISAGGTREAIDPVRFLTNRSSGKQGYALATIAHARGAEVTLISAAHHQPNPAGVTVIPVQSALDMEEAMLKYAAQKDIIIMAAAVADFRPEIVNETKVKKKSQYLDQIKLIENTDILARLVDYKRSLSTHHQPIIVGFAAETGDAKHSVLEYARMKLQYKGCDLLVVNAVGNGKAFEVDDNSGWILDNKYQPEQKLELGSKYQIANTIFDKIQAYTHS